MIPKFDCETVFIPISIHNSTFRFSFYSLAEGEDVVDKNKTMCCYPRQRARMNNV